MIKIEVSKMKMKPIMCLLLAGICFQANAGSSSNAKVANIRIHEGNILMFQLENHSNEPGCSNGEWAVSLVHEKGRAMLSMLLSAASMKKGIHVSGANDCNDWGDRERPIHMSINY